MIRPTHEVHPWRRRLGYGALCVAIVVTAVFFWNQREAANQIENAVRVWTERAELDAPPRPGPGAPPARAGVDD